MTSFDAKEFDKYIFNLTIHPKNTTVTSGAIAAGKQLDSIHILTPNNFRQFPRQKYYFSLEYVQLSGDDNPYTTVKGAARQDVYFDTGIPGLYNYTNFKAGELGVKSTDPTPVPRAGTGMVPIHFTKIIGNSYRGIPMDSVKILQVPNFFGQTCKFRFLRNHSSKTKTSVANAGTGATHITGADGDATTFDYKVEEVTFKHPVVLTFQVYVEKGGNELN